MAVKNERTYTSDIRHTFAAKSCHSVREAGSSTGLIHTYGRTNKEFRQKLADRLATPTETATVTKISDTDYRIDFTVTHRMVPVEVLAAAGIE